MVVAFSLQILVRKIAKVVLVVSNPSCFQNIAHTVRRPDSHPQIHSGVLASATGTGHSAVISKYLGFHQKAMEKVASFELNSNAHTWHYLHHACCSRPIVNGYTNIVIGGTGVIRCSQIISIETWMHLGITNNNSLQQVLSTAMVSKSSVGTDRLTWRQTCASSLQRTTPWHQARQKHEQDPWIKMQQPHNHPIIKTIIILVLVITITIVAGIKTITTRIIAEVR